MSQPPQIQSKENQYALDPSSAESQVYVIEATTAIDDKRSTLRDKKTVQLPDNEEPTHKTGLPHEPQTEARGNANQNNAYAKYLDPYARVWSLYLKATEAEDRELVEFWKDGLDSLLIFAGLFAAVLTAFLIESRKGLEDNPVEVLLQQINQSLRNSTSALEPRPFSPGLSLPVNFLWFVSLVLTLTSGLSAVLAQGWIRKYLPLTAGRTGTRDDAYKRHLRVIRARQWHLTSILGVIPLLLQLSVLLFLMGLVIFVWNDSHGLGQAIIAITGVTLALYAIATVLPWISPENPIETTLSSVFYLNDSFSHRSPYRLPLLVTSDSAWPSRIWESLLHLFRKPDQDTIMTLILAWIITNSNQDEAKDEAVRAMAGLKGQWHETLSAFTVCQASPEFFKRLEVIRENNDLNTEEEVNDFKEAYFIVTLKLIAMGQPVESVIEVLKEEYNSVRANALNALADFSFHTEYLRAVKGAIPDVLDMLKDENALVRQAACSNLGKSSKQLRLIPLMKKAVPKIFEIFKTKDFDMWKVAFNTLREFSMQPELSQLIKSTIGSAIKECLNQNAEYLGGLSELFDNLDQVVGTAEIAQDIKHSIQLSFEMFQDDKLWTQNTYPGALVEVLGNSGLIHAIKRLVPFVTNKFIFVDKPDHAEAVDSAINVVLDMLQDENFWTNNAVGMFTKIFEQPKVQQAIRISTPLVAKTLKERTSAALNEAINKTIKQPMLRRAIKDSVPVVLDILENETLYTDDDTILNILNEMFNQQEIIHLIITSMPTIRIYLRHDDPAFRGFALVFLMVISRKSDMFIYEIQRAILIVLTMRNDEDDNIREGVTKWLEELSKQRGWLCCPTTGVVNDEFVAEFNEFFKEWDHESLA